VGIIVVMLIGVGGFMLLNQPEPQESGNGDNGGTTEPPDSGALIVGIIKDGEENPIEGVQVKAGDQTTLTLSNGSYTIPINIGSYIVEATKTDYKKGIKTLNVEENTSYTANFTIEYNPASSDTGKKLKIITRHGSDIISAAENAFLASDAAKNYNISGINWISLGPTLWVDGITNIGNLDVAWGGGPVLFDVVNGAGLLEPITDPTIMSTLENIPVSISGVPTRREVDENLYWVGSAISSFGFTVNTQTLELVDLPEPTKWIDLANETYAAALPDPILGTADAASSTSNTRMFTIILQAYGWEDGWNILIRKGANSKIFIQSGNVRDAVITGNIGVGTTIDFYGYTAQMQTEFAKYIMPQDGTIVNADPIALLTTTSDMDAAQAFISWVISSEGQKIWLERNINRLPINPSVFQTPEGLARSDLADAYNRTKESSLLAFSDELALSYESAMVNFYHATIATPQLTLVDVWLDMTIALENEDITREEFNDLVSKLGDPNLIIFVDPDTSETTGFTQEYAQSINSMIASDAGYKDIMRSLWSTAAETHYNNVGAELQSLID